jgi:ribonuclease VapC
MILLDTSALMAVALDEPEADFCSEVMACADAMDISTGTLTGALIGASRRDVGAAMERLINGLRCQIAPVTGHGTTQVAAAFSRWGRGVHAAGLNYGDCFAYALARQSAGPLLFVGDDFTKTDIEAAS